MGKIEKNAVLKGFSCAIGENLVLRQVGKQTFFSRRTAVKNPRSEHQKANRNRFAEATLFAVSELKKPDAGLLYKVMAELQGLKTAHHAAVSDFLSYPEIAGINPQKYNGRVGDLLGIMMGVNWKYIATPKDQDQP